MKHRTVGPFLFALFFCLFLLSGPCSAEDPQCPSPDSGPTGASGTASSVDPNALTGPAGFGAKHYIQLGAIHPYRIDFENDAAATAPAQQVDIINPLDRNLDRATFQLTEIGFGDTFIPVPEGTSQFETTVSMSYQDVSFEVDVKAGIDANTGEVYAHFYSIDPRTGLPPPVEIGFLPPEDGTNRGMGHVSYTINHLRNIPENTEIRNIARIVFDMGEEIYTNQVAPHDPLQGTDPQKEALVTIDSQRPPSSILYMENVDNTTYKVLWGGYDSGSGIAGYTLYVRDANQLNWDVWQDNVQETEAQFTGLPGHTYEFAISSVDNVGYRETKDLVPEAKLTVPGLPDGDLDGIADDTDNCPTVSNAGQTDADGDGRGDACDDDQDSDGVNDSSDNCPHVANSDQADVDHDGKGDTCDDDSDNDTIGDAMDNCPLTANTDQTDGDGDGMGNVCDDDDDGDTIADAADNCPFIANQDQANLDGDGMGNVCDEDDDGDGAADAVDNCLMIANANQADLDGDTHGDLCDDDDDGDGFGDTEDSCPLVASADQADLDRDGQGDVCDDDDDGDNVADAGDNCPGIANADQANLDGDNRGNLCDDDDDGDDIADTDDNCPVKANADQGDRDTDRIGDLCDTCPMDADNDIDADGICGDRDNCPTQHNIDQADFDRDNLGDLCDPQTCGNSVLETVELCDDGNLVDGDGCSAQCITETRLSITKAEVEWSKGLVKYKGTIGLPSGVAPVLLAPQSDITIGIADLTPVAVEQISFMVKGNDTKNWIFKGDGPVDKFHINWKGEAFDYKGVLHVKANHIGHASTSLEIEREGLEGAFSIQLGGVTIQVGADNTVATSPRELEIDINDQDGEIEVELPFALTPDMVMVISRPNLPDTSVNVADHFTGSIGMFDLQVSFDPQGRTGLGVPAVTRLRIALGQIGYPGYALIDSGWKSIKEKEWKFE